MKHIFIVISFLCCLNSFAQQIDVTHYGVKPNSFADATEGVKKAILACKNQSGAIISFPTGRYDFWPDKAEETHYYISNSSSEQEFPEKKQYVGLFLKNLNDITIEGNNSVFVFHGKMVAWILDACKNIKIQNLAVNYERPGMSELTLKEIGDNEVLAVVHPDSKYSIINGKLQWYGEKWVARNLFAILVNATSGVLRYSTWEPFEKSKAEQVAPLTVRFTGDFSKFKGQPGEVLTVRDRVRDYVCAFINRSENISLHNLHMNSMHGLGIVSQFSANLNYDSVFVEPAKNSGRVIASSADGMHFSGCKGQITINNCRFNGLHDDPINVHGTHLKITEIVAPQTLKVKFMHAQSYGFEAFVQGDSVALLHPASLQIFDQGLIKSAKLVSEREMLVEFERAVSEDVKVGDALENIAWTPAVTIKNSRFERTISRGTLITTRRKVLIENNVYYRTGMHPILIENDASGWYESGPVADVIIRGNVFEDCAFNSFPDNYIIDISPQNREMVPNYWVHKNIRIENNTFKVYDYPVLSARSTSGLTFVGNQIVKTNFMPAGKIRPSINLVGCTKVKVIHNNFGTGEKPLLQLEKMTKQDISSTIAFEIK